MNLYKESQIFTSISRQASFDGSNDGRKIENYAPTELVRHYLQDTEQMIHLLAVKKRNQDPKSWKDGGKVPGFEEFSLRPLHLDSCAFRNMRL